MQFEEYRVIARSVLALVRKYDAKQAIFFCGNSSALENEILNSGGKLVTSQEAKVCLCFQTMPPQNISDRHIPIIAVAKNGSHKEYAVRAVWEGIANFAHEKLETAETLKQKFEEFSYAEAESRDVYGHLPKEGGEIEHLQENEISKYICWCKENISKEADCVWLIRCFEWEENQKNEFSTESAPFLSVLTRTQGRREDGLTEVMLCLASQNDRDFEWLIIGHKLNQKENQLVHRIISETPEYLRKRIRFLPCEENGRTAPLNFGFSQAKGEYVAILDDDDIVMDNWVEQFHQAAKYASGAVLHAYPVKQNWKYTPCKNKGDALCAVSNFDKKYCRPYHKVEQLTTNYCPPVCLAFPTRAFQKWGIYFDSNLNVTEDWDYLTRVAVFCGVYDIDKVTSIYRWWENGVTSATLHKQKEWAETYQKLTERFSQLYFPISGADFRTATGACQKLSLELFAKVEEDFSPETKQICEGILVGNRYKYVFSHLPASVFHGQLRIDPCYFGGVVISGIRIMVNAQGSGETFVYDIDDVTSNGWWINNELAFLEEDPQIYFQIPDGYSADTITVEYTGPLTMSPSYAQNIANAIACTSAQLKVKSMNCIGPVPAKITCYGNHIHCNYQLDKLGPVSNLDFSPCLRGNTIIQKMNIQAESPSGENIPLTWKHNGIWRPRAAIFLRQPHYYATYEKTIKTLIFDFYIDGEISEGAALSLQNPLKYFLRKIKNKLLPR